MTAPAATGAPLTDTEHRNLAAVTGVLEHWNAHHVDGVLGFYDPEICWHNRPLEETYRGHAEVAGFLRALFDAFPDLRFSVGARMVRGDDVAETWVIRGTHRGTFLGVPATGRDVEIHGMSMIEMRGGRFLRDDFCFDAAAVMRQLGLLPSLRASQRPAARAALRVLVGARRWFGVRGGGR
jgi:steroid delta-isomerase-like uncharacterized protein